MGFVLLRRTQWLITDYVIFALPAALRAQVGVSCGWCCGNYPQSRCEGYNFNSVISEDSFQNVVSFTVKPINGNYGPWSTWTLCSKSCGGGVRSRVRNCTNPAPAFGGNDCSALGEPQESEPCKTRNICPGQYFAFYQSIVFWFHYSV